jgi:hypothetical protein
VEAGSRSPASGNGSRGVGCFFSGGVDSYYSLLKNEKEVTALILVHGFDVPLRDVELWGRVRKEIREVAKEFGKAIVEVETNLREITDPFVDWNDNVGCGLATVALALAPGFDRVIVPASKSYGDMEPYGSHPLLDPLWSTEALELLHDGGEAYRDEKVEKIAGHESVGRHLRVCWRNTGGAYNCGTCEKCLRTMLSLLAAGALDGCRTFEAPLTEEAVAAMEITRPPILLFAEENLLRLERAAAPEGILRGLRTCIDRYRGGRLALEIAEAGPGFLRTDEWRNVRDRVLDAVWETQRAWLVAALGRKVREAVTRRLPWKRLLRRFATGKE